MSHDPLKVAYVTAGAAGMFCGSCMLDNTLVRALRRQGVDAQLIPTYTPIRTDEENVSIDRVFFGGINVYLEQKIPLFRHIPSLLVRFLDQPWLIRRMTAKAVEIDPKELGALTVSMLRGTDGFQKKEVRRLCRWLAHHMRADIIQLTNLLIGGCVPELKRRLGIPVLVTLQGDDIFLDDLPEPFRSQAFKELYRLVAHVDGFVVHSQYYADFMADYFRIPEEKMHRSILGIETADFAKLAGSESVSENHRPLTIGYLARLAPEKGLHHLVDAFIHLRRERMLPEARLEIAGWLGAQNQAYAEEQFEKLRAAGLADAFRYWGSVTREEKSRFLNQIDVLSVPTTYHDPKGLFVLESLAAGVPVVQPSHGTFPELIAATGGGRLSKPDDHLNLADTLCELLSNRQACQQLGESGKKVVQARYNADAMAERTMEIYRQFVTT